MLSTESTPRDCGLNRMLSTGTRPSTERTGAKEGPWKARCWVARSGSRTDLVIDPLPRRSASER
eukprot:4084240-Pyramimonas_sp.AAC.1